MPFRTAHKIVRVALDVLLTHVSPAIRRAEVGLGLCEAAHTEEPATEFDHTDAFVCTKPYAEVVHIPGKFIGKHHRPIKFRSKECKKETLFGEDEIITPVRVQRP